MKKLLTISLALLFSAYLNAQGTLQFDRAFYTHINPATNTFVVPANQVCKITHASINYDNNNNKYLKMKQTGTSSNDYTFIKYGGAGDPFPGPIWLPEGSYDFYGSTNGAVITGIFFNIVP